MEARIPVKRLCSSPGKLWNPPSQMNGCHTGILAEPYIMNQMPCVCLDDFQSIILYP